MFMPFWYPTFIVLIPAVLLALYAQFRVKSAYAQYSQVPVSSGLTGAQAAGEILRRNGLSDVSVERGGGALRPLRPPHACAQSVPRRV